MDDKDNIIDEKNNDIVDDSKNNNDIIKNDDDNKYEDICYMCRRPESQTGRLLKMAGSFCVCADCMQKTFNLMNAGDIPGIPIDLNTGKNDDKNTPGGFNPFGFNIGYIGDIPKSQRLKKKRAESTASDNPEEEAHVLDFRKLPPPHKIKESLDEYVIGQEKAKKVISVAVYNHYKRVTKDASGDIEIGKSNMLMIGPTGCGKTYLVQTLARILNVPLAITDATSLTEAGYIGDDVESVLSKLLMAADNDVERAETGIVFIDEIDKIAKKKNTTSRDVSGESVQQGLLRILEGADVQVPVGATSKNAMVPMTNINTRNILFICGGAFPDLEKIIKKRLLKGSGIGFNSVLSDRYDEEDVLSHVSNEDLREFGMIPEFIGRLPVIYTLKGLDKSMLIKIMSEPKNAILKQYQKLLALDDVELLFDDDALEAIAEKAMAKETGARGLRSIIEEFMLDIMYEIPKDRSIGRVTITRDYIESKGGPRIELHGATTLIPPLSEGGAG